MRRIWAYRFRRTTLWLMLFLGIVLGVGAAHTGYEIQWYWCLALGLFVFLSWRKHSWVRVLLVLLFGLACGWWRGGIYLQRLSVYDNLQHQKITITARAMNDALYGKTK